MQLLFVLKGSMKNNYKNNKGGSDVKSLTKSVGFVIYFIVAQCIASFIFIFWKIAYDIEWCEQLCDTLFEDGMLSSEYFSMIGEACVPMLIIADVIVMIPILWSCFKKHTRIISKISVKETFKLFSIGLVLNFVITVIVNLLPQSDMTNMYEQITTSILGASPVIVFISSAIFAPITEELIFRFGICGFVYKDNVKLGVIISSLLFGLAHMNLIQSTYAFALGLIIANVYVKSNYNLLTAIIVHITINGSSILYEYVPHNYVILAGLLIGIITLALYETEINVWFNQFVKCNKKKTDNCIDS